MCAVLYLSPGASEWSVTLFRCFLWENAFLSEVSRWIASRLQAYFVWPTQMFLSCLFISCLLTFENWGRSHLKLCMSRVFWKVGVSGGPGLTMRGVGVAGPQAWVGDTHAAVPSPPPSGFISVHSRSLHLGSQLEPSPTVVHRLNLYENKQRWFWWGRRKYFPSVSSADLDTGCSWSCCHSLPGFRSPLVCW